MSVADIKLTDAAFRLIPPIGGFLVVPNVTFFSMLMRGLCTVVHVCPPSYENCAEGTSIRALNPVSCVLQYKACMIEAFRKQSSEDSDNDPTIMSPLSTSSSSSSSSYHIVKRCMSSCPMRVNGSAEHTRCCVTDICNDMISIGRLFAIQPRCELSRVRRRPPNRPLITHLMRWGRWERGQSARPQFLRLEQNWVA